MDHPRRPGNTVRPTKGRILTGLVLTAAVMLSPNAASSRTLEFVEQQADARLTGASTLGISGDGKHVYVGAYRTVVFERDEITGEIGYVDTMDGANKILISPDGRNLYLHDHGPLRVMARDAESGLSTAVETWTSQTTDIWSMSPSAVTISPDGRHVYIAAYSSTLVVFSREPRTGVLTWVETLYDGFDGVVGLDGARHLTVSPDGAHFYVVARSYLDSESVTVFARDAATGRLSFVEATVDGPGGDLGGIVFMQISPDGRHAYVASREGVVTFARDPSHGGLSYVGVDGDYASSLAISPDGTTVYAIKDWGDAVVSVFARHAVTGTLNLIASHVGGLDGLDDAEALAVTPDGRHLYVVGHDAGGWVVGFERDAATGTLNDVWAVSNDVVGDADGVWGAESVATSPDGRHVYLASRYGDLSAFYRSPTTGKLQFIATYDDDDGFEGLDNAAFVTVSPDGRNVYVASVQPDHALVVLARDAETGELDFLEAHFDGVGGVDGLDYANTVVVSPDGRNVYVTSHGDDAVVAFARDVGIGELTFLAAYVDGVGSLNGLSSARGLAISPDGRQIYVGAYSRVVVFDRDEETGLLTLNQIQANGQGGVIGLQSILRGLVVSPDGRHLYVAGYQAVATFDRDVDTGELSFLAANFEGVSFGRDLAMSSDGQTLYVFGGDLVVFSRNPVTGALHLVESDTFRRYVSYWGPTGVLSPDGSHLYIVASLSGLDAIVVMRRTDGLCQAGPRTLCLSDNRFRVEVDWRNYAGTTGTGRAVPHGSGDSGLLWYFDDDNWEMLIKVLDACDINGRFWLLAAATTDVEYTLRVTDVATGLSRSYVNPLGNASDAIIDTFETCGARSAAASDESVDLSAEPGPLALGSEVTVEAMAEVFGSTFEASSDGSTTSSVGGPRAWSPPRDALKGFDPRTLLVGIGDKCLDIEGASTEDGTPVNLYECHQESNQRWYFLEDCDYGGCSEDFEIRGLGDKCLQPAASESSSTPLVIGACGGSEDRWIYRGLYPERLFLEHVDTGKCADVEGAGTDDGTPVNLYDCHDGDNQIWNYRAIRCVESPIHRCLNQNRFLVDIEWRSFTGETGRGRAVRLGTADSGLYWFFEPDNWEMLVKVLDGCDDNGHHWVFAAGTTNVEYTLRVTDTETGQIREYFNPLGSAAPAITDTAAFATCP